MPDSSDDLACLSPDQRRCEIAAILAQGILRLRGRVLPASNPAESPPGFGNSPKSCRKALELSTTFCPDGPTG